MTRRAALALRHPSLTIDDHNPLITDQPTYRLSAETQYFSVLPARRGRGHGRALWRASMSWGQANGAAYKILQAPTGTPAEQLYLSEGLQTLGFIRTT